MTNPDPVRPVAPREELLKWAAELVRVVCGAELARDVDRDVAEPVRRIALQMRDAAYSLTATPVPCAASPADHEALAQRFHEAYERLAPSFGYETRKASAKPWADVPEQNRNLMIAVCAELLRATGEGARDERLQTAADVALVPSAARAADAGSAPRAVGTAPVAVSANPHRLLDIYMRGYTFQEWLEAIARLRAEATVLPRNDLNGHLPDCRWSAAWRRYVCVNGCEIKRINDSAVIRQKIADLEAELVQLRKSATVRVEE